MGQEFEMKTRSRITGLLAEVFRRFESLFALNILVQIDSESPSIQISLVRFARQVPPWDKAIRSPTERHGSGLLTAHKPVIP